VGFVKYKMEEDTWLVSDYARTARELSELR
jgi:hypothetical protein